MRPQAFQRCQRYSANFKIMQQIIWKIRRGFFKKDVIERDHSSMISLVSRLKLPTKKRDLKAIFYRVNILIIQSNRLKSYLNLVWICKVLHFSRFPHICRRLYSLKYEQKHSEGVLWKRYSLKFHKIHRKTPVPESLFS